MMEFYMSFGAMEISAFAVGSRHSLRTLQTSMFVVRRSRLQMENKKRSGEHYQ